MNDTVTRLLEMADRYATVVAQQGESHDHIARDALQDELTKLFTSLSSDEISRIAGGECWAEDGIDPQLFAKEIEAAHGIGETK